MLKWLDTAQTSAYEAWRRGTADQRQRDYENWEAAERARNIAQQQRAHPDAFATEINHVMPALRQRRAGRQHEHLAAAQEYSARLRDQAARAAAEAQAVAQVRATWPPEGAR